MTLLSPFTPFEIGGGDVAAVTAGEGMVMICGPCVIESEEHLLRHAQRIAGISANVGLPLIFKSSYDKANRTSLNSFRGHGVKEGLKALQLVRQEVRCPVITDVHSVEEVELVAETADVIQVPAFLCRQTDLLVECGRSGKPVLVKKGQFLSPSDMQFAAEKIVAAGNRKVMLCERGSCFGYRDLVVDFRSFSIMRELGFPVIFDATHSVQVIGGADGKSGGNRKFVAPLARAAAAAGIDGLFIEAHENPDGAPSDGPNMVPLDELEKLLAEVVSIRAALKSGNED